MPEFLSRYDFNMSAAKLAYPDQRFSWDTHWGGDFDLVDYVDGRVTFIGDYQALLGSEFRPFDPYQSNYLLEASDRTGSARPKSWASSITCPGISAIASSRWPWPKIRWVRASCASSRTTRDVIELRGNVRKVIARAYVDYTWMADVDLIVQADWRPQSRPVRAELRPDHHRRQDDRRAWQPGGGRVEAGVQLNGVEGAMELFVGAERVIDADQLDRVPRAGPLSAFGCCGTDDP